MKVRIEGNVGKDLLKSLEKFRDDIEDILKDIGDCEWAIDNIQKYLHSEHGTVKIEVPGFNGYMVLATDYEFRRDLTEAICRLRNRKCDEMRAIPLDIEGMSEIREEE
jgi:hypothetical protein